MKKYDGMTDEMLISLLREGDDAVTDFLVEKYINMVRKKAESLYIAGADNDDLIQEGRIGLFEAIKRFNPSYNASFYTFAEKCVLGQMHKAVQAGNRKKHAPLNSYISLNGSDISEENDYHRGEEVLQVLGLTADNDPETLVIDKYDSNKLEDEIFDCLSELEQRVLELKMCGYNYSEVAKILGKSDKQIDNALTRIKKKVKDILHTKTE